MIGLAVLLFGLSFSVAIAGGMVQVLIASENSPFLDPRSMASGVDGLLYVADTGNNRLLAIDSAGNIAFESSIGGSASELRRPVDVAIGAGGQVYVADAGNRRIVEFSRLLEWRSELIVEDESGNSLEPKLLATSAKGDLYVYESDNGQLLRYDSFFNVIARLGGQSGSSISEPRVLSYSDANGLLWIDQRERKLYRCDSFLSDPREFAFAGIAGDIVDITCSNNAIFVLSESSIYRQALRSLDSLSFESLGLLESNSTDMIIKAHSLSELYILDRRHGSLLRLNWP